MTGWFALEGGLDSLGVYSSRKAEGNSEVGESWSISYIFESVDTKSW